MRVLTAVAALGALGALLVGVPWFLWQFADLAYLLSADWWAALTVGADGRLIIALLGAVGWVAWAVLALTTLFELIAVLSRYRINIRLPGTGWLRPAVGALVAAAVAAPTMAAADSAPPAGTIQQQSAVDAVANPSESRSEGRQYVVQDGDELWGVAERQLGSGELWRSIVELNEGLEPESRLAVGSVLRLPEDAVAPPATVVVEEGDTLWHIAGEELGDPTRWPEIHEANQDRIADPDQIDVGWELRLPEVASEPAEIVEESELADVADEAFPADEATPHTPEDAAAEAVAEAFGSGFPVEPAEREGYETVAGEVIGDAGVPADGAVPDDAAGAAEETDSDDYSGLLAPLGATLASAVLVGVGGRRRAQLLARAVGRRLVPVPTQVARFWTALGHRAEAAEPTEAGNSATTLVLGWDGEETVTADVEAERALIFTGEDAPAALSAAVTGLTCAPWSEAAEVLLVGGSDWVAAMDDPVVTNAPTTTEGLERLTRLCSERRLALRHRTLSEMRADADLAEAFTPTVVVFLNPLTPTELDTVSDAIALGQVGVSVLASTTQPLQLPFTQVRFEAQRGSLRGRNFTPQLITAPARRALLDLFATTGSTDTEPAPWWVTDDDLPPNVLPLPRQDRPEERAMTTVSSPSHPTLLMLGDLEITGAAGTPPTRAVGQCMEYCAWLLHHPGSTPTLMMRDLQVVDTTRRSNMSRLRTWLGSDAQGAAYLPDAYTGRVRLDERVTSDWEQFNALLAGGVTLASTGALRAALALVRGEPLGTFAFQWHWAQQLHADMVAMIVDAACVLADRSLVQGDLTAALWAIAQGRMGAPFDDALSVREIEALRLAGRHAEAEHAVVRLNRMLRAEGRDLNPALAARVQDAMRARPQRAAVGARRSAEE